MKQITSRILVFRSNCIVRRVCDVQLDGLGQSRNMPSPRQPAKTTSPASGNADSRVSQRAVLQQHEKDFRESLAKLSERAQELTGNRTTSLF
jgi:hypothetical protein